MSEPYRGSQGTVTDHPTQTASPPNPPTLAPQSIPKDRVKAMLATVSAIWQRWTWRSVVTAEGTRQRVQRGYQHQWALEAEKLGGDEAFSTLMQVGGWMSGWGKAHMDTVTSLSIFRSCWHG